MAITQWDPLSLPVRPGLYTNFVDAAIAQIQGGQRGIVAIPLKTYSGGNAVSQKMYTVEKESEAIEYFGAANITSIKLALQGGAKEVLVYTLPAGTQPTDFVEMRNAFEARPFNVFVFDGEPSTAERTNTVAWIESNRKERKHFTFVTGGTSGEDANITTGNTRSTSLKDDYVINLVSGVTVNGVNYSSGQYAAYIAGLVASTPINKSITYQTVRVDDVTKRLRNSEIVSALQAGSLVLVNDGVQVKIEQGITTAKSKIRKISARQQIATDIERTARENYIGRLDNDEDGQMSLINAIKAYLETLEKNNVLTSISVILDPLRESVGDKVFLAISFYEVDSMEQIFLSIAV